MISGKRAKWPWYGKRLQQYNIESRSREDRSFIIQPIQVKKNELRDVDSRMISNRTGWLALGASLGSGIAPLGHVRHPRPLATTPPPTANPVLALNRPSSRNPVSPSPFSSHHQPASMGRATRSQKKATASNPYTKQRRSQNCHRRAISPSSSLPSTEPPPSLSLPSSESLSTLLPPSAGVGLRISNTTRTPTRHRIE